MLESTIIDEIITQIAQQTVGWHVVCVSFIIALVVSFIFWVIASRLTRINRADSFGEAILVYIIVFLVTLGVYATYLEHDLTTRIQTDPNQTVLMTSIKAKIADIEKDMTLLNKNEEAYQKSRLKKDQPLAVRIFGNDKASIAALSMTFGMILGAAGIMLVRAIIARERHLTEQKKACSAIVYGEHQTKPNQQTGEHHV